MREDNQDWGLSCIFFGGFVRKDSMRRYYFICLLLLLLLLLLLPHPSNQRDRPARRDAIRERSLTHGRVHISKIVFLYIPTAPSFVHLPPEFQFIYRSTCSSQRTKHHTKFAERRRRQGPDEGSVYDRCTPTQKRVRPDHACGSNLPKKRMYFRASPHRKNCVSLHLRRGGRALQRAVATRSKVVLLYRRVCPCT